MKSLDDLLDSVSFLRAVDELAATWRSKRASSETKRAALKPVYEAIVAAAPAMPAPAPAPKAELPVQTRGGMELYSTPEQAGLTFDPFKDPLEPVAEPVQPTRAEIMADQAEQLRAKLEGKGGEAVVYMPDDFWAGEANEIAAAIGWRLTAPVMPVAGIVGDNAQRSGGSGWKLNLAKA